MYDSVGEILQAQFDILPSVRLSGYLNYDFSIIVDPKWPQQQNYRLQIFTQPT